MPRVRLLGIVARHGRHSCRRCATALPHVVNTPELRFDCDDTRKFDGDRGGRRPAAGGGRQRVRTSTACACRPTDGWWLLRASNTQAVLVARAEASDEAGLERLKAALAEQLAASGLAAPDFSGAHAGH